MSYHNGWGILCVYTIIVISRVFLDDLIASMIVSPMSDWDPPGMTCKRISSNEKKLNYVADKNHAPHVGWSQIPSFFIDKIEAAYVNTEEMQDDRIRLPLYLSNNSYLERSSKILNLYTGALPYYCGRATTLFLDPFRSYVIDNRLFP